MCTNKINNKINVKMTQEVENVCVFLKKLLPFYMIFKLGKVCQNKEIIKFKKIYVVPENIHSTTISRPTS